MSQVRHVRLGSTFLAAVLALAIAPAPVAGGSPDGAPVPTVAAVPARVRAVSSTPAVPSASAIVPGSVNRSSMQVRATYDADVTLSFGARTLAGRVTVTALNRSGAGIDRLELNTVMASLGGLRLRSVTVDGRAVTARIDDQTVVVPFGGVLPDGATTTVVLRFAATLRSTTSGSTWLFARANGIADLYRWLPWVSRRTPFARPNFGDPFVTPVSPAVHVVIRTDVPLRFATTGTPTAVSANGLVSTFDAANVRDFVVAASRDATTRTATVGPVTVRVVARGGFPAAAVLTAAKAALTKLVARLGPYPYRVLTVAESAGGYGMEGPGTVWIPPVVPSANLTYLVTHEVAHGWFYALVGNDQAREPFADEAMTDMVARYVLGMRRSSACSRARLDLSIYRYSMACYYEDVYIQGGNLLDDARRAMGTTTFFAAVRGYLSAHRFGLVHTRTLLDAIDAATPLNLRARWIARFPSLY